VNQVSHIPRRRSVTQPATAQGQQTRQRLLDAAEAVFGEKGYDRASVAEITQRAGVAQGTFYIYFPDKQSTFVELVRDLSHRLRLEIAQSVANLTDRLEVERAGFRSFFAFIHNHRNLYRIVRQAEFVDEEVYRWYYRHLAEAYSAGLSQAMQKGQIRQLDAECLAYCLMGIADFLGARYVLWDGDHPPEEAIETMMQLIQHGIAVGE
jgi:AcrR family transcriptional regulator